MADDEEEAAVGELVERVIRRGLEELARKQQSGSKEGLEWPTSEQFTVERGLEAIVKTVQGWRLSGSWKHCIDYLGTRLLAHKTGDVAGGQLGGEGRERGEGGEGEEGGVLHWYRVQWSEPTRRKPVPMATASVYFFIQQQSTQEKTPVNVFYVLEGQHLVHRPHRTTFQEVWLRNIIQHKLSVLNTNPQWAPIRTA